MLLEIQSTEKDGWNPITGLTLPQLCACPKPEHGFPTFCGCDLFHIQ